MTGWVVFVEFVDCFSKRPICVVEAGEDEKIRAAKEMYQWYLYHSLDEARVMFGANLYTALRTPIEEIIEKGERIRL